MKNFLLPCLLFWALWNQQASAQQYKWTKNNGAAATLGSSIFFSPNSNNETWIIPPTSSATRFFGAGNGVAPDLGTIDTTGSFLQRFDANMNLVWSVSNNSASIIVADPLDATRFYIAGNYTANSSAVYGAAVTGQVAASAAFVAHCQASGTNTVTALWVAKVDGLQDETVTNLVVKSLSATQVRIALEGTSRSDTVRNYSNGTTAIGQVVPLPGTGNVFNTYISCFNETLSGSTATIAPLWINTFGNPQVPYTRPYPICMNDNGDVIFAAAYVGNTLGELSYALRNSSGASPGTVTTTSYTANISGSITRYMLMSLKAADGSVVAVKNELGNTACNIDPRGIAADALGNIFLYTMLRGSYAPGGMATTITSLGSADVAVIVFDNTLLPLRAQRYGNTSDNTIPNHTNTFALDRANARMYMVGITPSGFTAGQATVQQLSGQDGFILAANSITMGGLSAVSCIGTAVANTSENIGSVAVRPDGNIIATQQYTGAGHNRLNAGTAVLLPKTAYGYQDVAITKFDGTITTLLTPVAEGGVGATTNNVINASALKGAELLSIGTYSGSMTIGSTTLSGSGAMMVLTDTATGTVNSVYSLTGSVSVSDVRVSPVDGSMYILGSTSSTITNSFGASVSKTVAGKNDAFLSKYDASFNHIWTVYVGGAEQDYGKGLAIDPTTGDAYISGQFFSDGLRLNAAGTTAYTSTVIAANSNAGLPISADAFVAKFSSAGSLQWISTGGNSSTTVNDSTARTLLYLNGNVYTSMQVVSAATINLGGQSITTSNGGGGTLDMVLGRLNATDGTATWLKTWANSRGDEYPQTLVTYNNLIYTGGYCNNNNAAFNLGGSSFVTSGSWDGFIFAVNESGTDQAGLIKVQGTGSEYINEIKTDAVGNLFFAGSSNSSSVAIAGSTLGTSGGSDCLIGVADANTMTLKFGFMAGSPKDEGYNTVMPGLLGMAFAGGNLKGTATFGNTTLQGRLGGDFLFARLDYPYIGPGAQVSNLNTWFKANTQLSGNPATKWVNSSTNGILDTLTVTGTVPVNAAGLNYNPSFEVSGTTSYLSKGNIFPSNFLDASGSKFSVYTVLKPTASTDQLQLWSESTTGTGISLGTAGNTITGTGGAKIATHTTALSLDQYSISSLLVNGSTMSNYVNGTANGVQTGVTAVSTTNAGNFRTGGTGNMSIAEIITYGGSHTASNPPINRIETYLAIKYGITLKHHYYSTVGDTVFKYSGTYINNVAGIGRDDNELLLQKQSVSQNSIAKGNMLAIGVGTLANSNAENTGSFSQDKSYLIWADDAGSVTTTSSSNIPTGYSSCAYRLPRTWKIHRTGTGTGATQVKMDINNTAATGTQPADFWLLIDQDGDGSYATGTTIKVQGASFSAGVVTFNNIAWDADASGSDAFTLLVDITSNMPAPALVTTTTSVSIRQHTCTDVGGYLQFVNVLPVPSQKLMAVHPRGNTGYNFSARCSNDSASYIANQMKTDGSTNTTALMNRMYSIDDAGTNNYTLNGGMTVRLYYSAADSAAAVAALDPAVNGISSFGWFKVSGSSTAGTVASAKLAKESQIATGISAAPQYGATLLVPARYGTEAGIRYVEFDGVKNFSTFAAIAKRGAAIILPISFVSTTAQVNKCSVNMNWRYTSTSTTTKPLFEVERSSNGVGFALAGKTSTQNFIDQPPYTGIWYYRIKVTNAAGSISYSSIMMAQMINCENIVVSVYPNPASKQVKIQMIGNNNLPCRYDITDGIGQKVVTGIVEQASAETINVSNLPAGMYILNVHIAGKVVTQKILISHN